MYYGSQNILDVYHFFLDLYCVITFQLPSGKPHDLELLTNLLANLS
jgi:hypothetical protein